MKTFPISYSNLFIGIDFYLFIYLFFVGSVREAAKEEIFNYRKEKKDVLS
jgi:hypothetical protein